MTTHFYTADANERQNAISNLGFTDEGIACYVFSAPPPGQAPLFRAYHPTSGAHFYTMSLSERDNATNRLGYVAEGIAAYIFGPGHPGAVPLYRAYRGAIDDHFYTTSLAEHNNAVQNLGYSNEGITGYVLPAQSSGNQPLYRLVKGTHFYTIDANERQNAIQNLGFTDEGIACYVFGAPPAGQAPLFRAYHPATGAHFYTMSMAERDNATNRLGYVAEGIACYILGAQAPGDIPLYRAYQPGSDDHFYTTNLAEHNNAVQHLGYIDEGVTGQVFPTLGVGVPFYRMYGPAIARHLALVEQHQQQTEWCWAATTVSITLFYDPKSTWTQCTLVNHAFNQTTCCTNGSSSACNQPWYPDQALTITGHLSSTSNSSQTFATVMREIMASRPISIAIYWKGGGGHNPAISGFDNSRPASPTIDLQDPWYGPSTQDFNTFPSTYQGGASWGVTYFTK